MSYAPAILTARQARACCTCAHWHKLTEEKGECRHPDLWCGLGFRNEATGEVTCVEWWTTGCYHTCRLYSANPVHPVHPV